MRDCTLIYESILMQLLDKAATREWVFHQTDGWARPCLCRTVYAEQSMQPAEAIMVVAGMDRPDTGFARSNQ